jgi:AraC family transcriptional regulator of adaptative response/methylated-DNA-[protein]-cysteine methyltransferase
MPTVDALAADAGMSRFHFHRVFKSITGVTPKAYAAAHRAERIRNELSRSATVTEAIYGAGFNCGYATPVSRMSVPWTLLAWRLC